MAGQRIPDLTAVTGANTANNDSLLIFDADANVTKRILRSQLAIGLTGDLPLQYYLGVLNSNPATRLDGSPLQLGDYYLDSVTKYASVYDGSGWSSYASVIAAKTAAEAAAVSAGASFDSFDDRYLGAKSSDPTLDNDGNALATGALYWNTPGAVMKAYTGSAWVNIAEVSSFISGQFGPLGGFRNRLLNGDFNVWQRGTSQTSSGYGSDDRWINFHSGSTKTHSLQAFTLGQTDVPGEPEGFSRTVVSSVAGAANLVVKTQRIEGVRTFAGQTVTLSFWAKADANRPIALEFSQNFGTGGTPSASVFSIGMQKFSLTTAWQKFTATVAIPSISGKTLGTDSDFLEMAFWYDAGSDWDARTDSLGQQSGTFDIARVQLEASSVATPFEPRPFSVEFSLCQRYYQSAPFGILYGAYATDAYAQIQIGFPTLMRFAPTVALTTLFNAGVATVAAVATSNQTLLIRATASGASLTAEVSGLYQAVSEL